MPGICRNRICRNSIPIGICSNRIDPDSCVTVIMDTTELRKVTRKRVRRGSKSSGYINTFV